MKNQLVVDGLLINFYKFQEGDKGTLLFLHGWRSEGMIWQGIIRQLDLPGYTIYALDLPGFGSSPAPDKPYAVADYAGFVSTFIQKLKLTNVILVGHSFGGRIGIKLAASEPEIIKKLVLVDSAGMITDQKGNQLKKTIAKIFKPFFRPKFMQPLRKKVYQMIGAEDYLATPELRETYLKVISEDLSTFLPKIKQPSLIIWGGKDKQTPLEYAEIMKKGIKDSSLVVLRDAGHFSFLDQPDEFAKQLTIFINK